MTVYQYLISHVFSSYGMALVTMNPLTSEQALFTSINVILSSFFIAYLYGEFSNQLRVLRRREDSFQRRIDGANTTMDYLNITSDLRVEVRGYIKKTNLPHEEQCELIQFT